MKKIIFLMIVLFICFGFVCGCDNGKKETVFGTVAIIGPENELILDTELYVNKDNATAAEAIKNACAEVRMSYTYTDGMFDNFNGIASTSEEGWLFYSEGDLSEVGAGECSIKSGFELEFRYENYTEAFSKEQ